MHHISQQIDEKSGRISIQPNSGLDQPFQSTIARAYFNKQNVVVLDRGTVLGCKKGGMAALIIHVLKGDLVVHRMKWMADSKIHWIYFRVNENFNLVRLDLPDRILSHQECRCHIKVAETKAVDQLDTSDTLFRTFSAESHPDWLDSIVSGLIRHWRTAKPEKLFRLAPSRVAKFEIPLCVKLTPFLALAHFKHLLSRDQITECIGNSLDGAIVYAFDEMTDPQITEAILEHPEVMIRHAANRLSDENLRLCVFIHPISAFDIRRLMPERRRAMTLAMSYQFSFLSTTESTLPDLHSEIIHSIIHFPKEWLSCHNNDYGSIFEGIQNFSHLTIDTKIIVRILEETSDFDRGQITEYLANKI